MLRRGADHVTFCWGFLNLIMEISEESHREMGANQNSVAKSQHELGRGNFPWNFLYELNDRLTAKGLLSSSPQLGDRRCVQPHPGFTWALVIQVPALTLIPQALCLLSLSAPNLQTILEKIIWT